MKITNAINCVSKANEALNLARGNLRLALSALAKAAPYKPGDEITHARHGRRRVSCCDAIPHDEWGALWQITIQPFLKDGKPSARKVQYLIKISELQP